MTVPIYTPANCVQGFAFLCILAKLVICRHFYKTHPNRCEVVLYQKPPNGFDFHFSHDSWWDMIIIQMIFCPFKNQIESESEGCSVVSNSATPWTIVHGILQARILEWGAFPFSRGSSQPKDRTQVSLIAGGFFTSWAITWNFLLWVENFLIYSGY